MSSGLLPLGKLQGEDCLTFKVAILITIMLVLVSLSSQAASLSNEGGDLVLRDDVGVVSTRLVPSVVYQGVEREISQLKLLLPSLSQSFQTKQVSAGWKWAVNITGVNAVAANNLDKVILRVEGSRPVLWDSYPNELNTSIRRITFDNGYVMDFKDLVDLKLDVTFVPEINQIWLTNLSNAYKSGTFFLDPTLQATCDVLSTDLDRYEITSNITAAGTCLTVTCSHCTVDGAGYNVSYGNESNQNTYGILISGQNVTVTNFSYISNINNSQIGVSGVRIQGNYTNLSYVNVETFGANTAQEVPHYALAIRANYSVAQYSNFSGNIRNNFAVEFMASAMNNSLQYNVINTRSATTPTGVRISATANMNNVSFNQVVAAGVLIDVRSERNTIDNNNITGTGQGILLGASTSDDNLIINNSARITGGTSAVRFNTQSNIMNNIITGNNFRTQGATQFVIEFLGVITNATGNNITNNILNSSREVWISNPPSPRLVNNFSVNAITAGTNIYGGNNLGGNYYTNTTLDGYSDRCTDADQDGICDTALTFTATNATDFYPLSNFTTAAPTAPQLAGNATIILPVNNDVYTSRNVSINYSNNDSTATTDTYYIYLNGTFNKSVVNINTTLNLSPSTYGLNVSFYNGSVWTSNDSRTFVIQDLNPALYIANVTIIRPIPDDILNFTNHTINYTLNNSAAFTYTFYLYLNGSFNQTRPANTTLNLSDGDYTINVSAFNTTHWSVNSSRSYKIRNTTQVAFSADLNGTLLLDFTSSSINITQNNTFSINASVTCSGGAGDCYNVNGTAYYNLTAILATPINASSLAVPFFNVTGLINQSCSGNLQQGEKCSYNLTINATGAIGTNWLMRINFTTNNSFVLPNTSQLISVNISEFIAPVSDTEAPTFANNGTNTSTARINQIIQFSINVSDNSALASIVLETNYTGVKANESFAISGTRFNFTVNKTYLLLSGRPPAYKWYVLDASGNVNSSVEQTLNTCIETWSCTDFIQNGTLQYRTCTDSASCGTILIRPITEQFPPVDKEGQTVQFAEWLFIIQLVIFIYGLFLSLQNLMRPDKRPIESGALWFIGMLLCVGTALILSINDYLNQAYLVFTQLEGFLLLLALAFLAAEVLYWVASKSAGGNGGKSPYLNTNPDNALRR